MNIGILGGTFDPIHMGHLILAEEARVRLGLSKVLFIPTGQPWLKAGRPISPGHHRLAMVRMAIEDNPFFEASDMEIRRPGPTYTLDTLRELRAQWGNGPEIYLLLGLDALQDFPRWHQPQRILEMCTLVGMARPGYLDFSPQVLDAVLPGASQRLVLLHGPHIGISGTEIRRRVGMGLSIRYWVPRPVELYIAQHGLYRKGGGHE
ncbi:MAG: nicotinate-nucleotide adenylyltransferase [Dehalococcoidia bacterium]|nr:nicotinate-nucleotide adenylyltransferase [Dehalococcoidia bacterium]MDW8120062.1 nicotinate-nucleotide adenylyltransferase [Chloroflexota bacterium]